MSSTKTDLAKELRFMCRPECECIPCQGAAEIERLRGLHRQIEAMKEVPHVNAQDKVGLMAALARSARS